MSIEANKRLLLQLDKYRSDVNKKTIALSVIDLNLDKLKPIVAMVAKSRASYISELINLAGIKSDAGPNPERLKQLKAKGSEFDELVKVTNALETAIERGYIDIIED